MCWVFVVVFVFFKQKTAYEMRISDWSSDVCSSDLAERGADEGGGDFGAQFLARIGLRSEAARLVAAQSLGVAGPVREFVKGGAIEIDLIAEGGLRRHGHEIAAGRIESLAAADAEIGAGGFYQRLGMGENFAGGWGRRSTRTRGSGFLAQTAAFSPG